MLEVKVENCAGIDVGKRFLAVCVLNGPVDRKPAEEVRRFGTTVKELERLCAPEAGILKPGIDYCITPLPSFLDRPGIENRVYFSYAYSILMHFPKVDPCCGECPFRPEHLVMSNNSI